MEAALRRYAYRPAALKPQHRGSLSTGKDKIFCGYFNVTFSQVNLAPQKGHFHKLLTAEKAIL